MLRKFGIAAAAIILVLLAAAVLMLWVEHKSAVVLPPLTGHYPVGRVAFDWVDPSRTDDLAPEMGTKRELTVWMWYPASIVGPSTASAYMPRSWLEALSQRQGPMLTNFMMHDRALVTTHSLDDAAVSPRRRSYPVILMKPGIGALALYYTTLAEDLASDGYIVVASDSPYSTFLVVYRDGRVAVRRAAGNPGDDAPLDELNTVAKRTIATWVADDRFVLDRLGQLNASDPSGNFKGRLDLKAVGVMGHSFGGGTAAEFCRQDARCRAGIDIDGIPFGQVVQTGLDRPFMFLMSDHSKEHDPDSEKVKMEIQNIYGRSPGGRLLVTLRGSGHFSFTDLPLIFNPFIARVSGVAGSGDPVRVLDASSACVQAFFDIHLNGTPSSVLQTVHARFPELVFASDSKPLSSQF